MPRRHPAALPDHLPNSSTSGPSSPSLDPIPMSPKRDTSPMSMSKKKVTPVSTTAERGDAMLRAKTLRLTQEQRLAEMRHRVLHLSDEEARIKSEIAETQERTRERKDLEGRSNNQKQVGETTRKWMSEELEHRRQQIGEQRKLTRQAIEAKRLALLQARHADFVLKKEEAAKARVTILQARAAKQQQKQAQMLSVRERHAKGKERCATFARERLDVVKQTQAIVDEKEVSETQQSLRELEMLAQEEKRLLESVHAQHAMHRKEFDDLQERHPNYRIGLHTNPAPFALHPPLAAHSPMHARRPATSLSADRTDAVGLTTLPPATPSSFPPSPERFCGHYRYGNSVPSSPRSGYGFDSRPGTSSAMSMSAASVPVTPRAL